MKKFSVFIVLLLILTGCDQKPSVQEEQESEKQVVKNDNNDFKTEIPLGTSDITGISAETDAYIDTNDMEVGLMDISKQYVDSQKYIYSPGQVLTSDDANELLSREGKDNPNGLNPAKTDDPAESPLYMNTMIEQDYFTYDENNDKNINTIAIGAGIDTSYLYDENKDPYQISDEEIEEFITPYLANGIAEYIHQKEGYEEVNIVFGLFKESEDGILPGSYYTYGYVPGDSNQIDSVEKTNISYMIFPNEDGNQQNINDVVTDLQSSVNSYFTDYSGLTAIGKFVNNKIEELDIVITINIYSQIDAATFTQYVIDSLDTNNIKEIPKIEINIKSSSNENIAVLVFENGQLETEHVYQNGF